MKTMSATHVPKKGCCKLPRWELIVWAYIKLFLANLLLIGTFFSWMGWHRDQTSVISNGLATAVAILDLAATGALIFGCNKKNVKAMKIFYFISQFFLGFVAALSVYEFIILILIIFGFMMPTWQAWIYLTMDKIILLAIFGIDICIFIVVGRLIKNKKFDHDGPGAESLFNVENLYDVDSEPAEETIQYKEETFKNAVLGA